MLLTQGTEARLGRAMRCTIASMLLALCLVPGAGLVRQAWAEEAIVPVSSDTAAQDDLVLVDEAPDLVDVSDTTGEDDIVAPDGLPADGADDAPVFGGDYSDNLRLYGADRYGTALNNAYFRYQQDGRHPCVVIAQGKSFPDALSGGYVAVKNDAPMLLLNADKEQNTLSYLDNYAEHDATVYLLGGKNVVSQGFESTLVARGYAVVRLAGGDRYGTNLDILRKTAQDSTELLVARGSTFPDALSGSSVGKPMLLVNGDLSAAQLDWLRQSNVSKFYILGGTSAVSTSVENQLRGMGSVERIGGANRYDTSAKIARRFAADASCITVATGTNFPDALSGAPVAAYFDAPLVLVSKGNWSYARSFVKDKGISQVVCIGGPKVVTFGTIAKIMLGTNSWPTLAQKGIKANKTWRFTPSTTDAQIDELLYDIEGYTLLYADAEHHRPITQFSGKDKVTAVLTYIGRTYSPGSSPKGSEMIRTGAGTCFAYSELVYDCLKKLGLTCWVTVPGRNRPSQNPMNTIYGSDHRSVVVKIDGKFHEADGNMAVYQVQFYGIAEPFEISTAYANFLIGNSNSFNG